MEDNPPDGNDLAAIVIALEHRFFSRVLLRPSSQESISGFLDTFAQADALLSRDSSDASVGRSHYVELLRQINPDYAREFARLHSRACKRRGI